MEWKFWKKEDGLPDFKDSALGMDTSQGMPGNAPDLSQHFDSSQSFAQPPPPSNFSTPFPSQPFASHPTQNQSEWESPGKSAVGKDLEIIAAKLDTIRAQLEMLNTRVANLEQQGKRSW